MNYNRLNIETEFPEPLTKDVQTFYFEEMADGNMQAREQIICHNLRLVTYVIFNNFLDTKLDKNELFSLGVIGLIKSVDKYDINKNIEFSTYAISKIIGEIKSFLREQQKLPNFMSIETTILHEKDSKLKIKDIASDDSDLVLDYEQKEIYEIINAIIENLPYLHKEVIKLYFGFYDNKPKSQTEIASILNLSQPKVSRILMNTLEQIKLKLYHQEILEYSDLSIKERYEQKEKNSSKKNIKTIYKLLKFYSKGQIDDMISRLTDEERYLILLKYGKDLENPVADEKWNKEYGRKFNALSRKMRYLLANPEKISNPKKVLKKD